MSCLSCKHFLPHPSYRFIGYCARTGSLIVGGGPGSCDMFEGLGERDLRSALEERGWVYCVDCRRAIFDYEEALDHLRRGELLAQEFMGDEVAPEEVPSAD